VTVVNGEAAQTAAQALSHLQNILKTAELDAEAALAARDGEDVTLEITGPDAGLLVGSHGQTLDALQHLLVLIVYGGHMQHGRITVDAAGYRARRTQTLTDFAHSLAAQVMESGQEAITDPLNAMERRVIHTALADHPSVRTYSEGEGPGRYVVISPRGSNGAGAQSDCPAD
jgi:spoIIIJ-associated protein